MLSKIRFFIATQIYRIQTANSKVSIFIGFTMQATTISILLGVKKAAPLLACLAAGIMAVLWLIGYIMDKTKYIHTEIMLNVDRTAWIHEYDKRMKAVEDKLDILLRRLHD